MSLETVLARVSHNCLRGQAVPADLRLLWEAKLDEDADLLDDMECTLVAELDEEFFDGYREDSGGPAYSLRAHRRMFEQIAFFARTMDGGMLGYWLGEGNRPIKDAPVVELDNEGQYDLKGTCAAEYLLLFTDSPGQFAEARAWLDEHGVRVTASNHQAIWDKLTAFEDPNAQSERYQEEEEAREDGPPPR